MSKIKSISELLKQKTVLEKQIAALKADNDSGVGFSVDAGLIDRLGKELVGRAETAVSELVKNSYDADANLVVLNFIDSDNSGGTLEIFDDGHGMNRKELINGFMRLSSSDKFHNPVSPHCKRVRAGKKGIGRFATQRLGEELIIITKRKEAKKGIKVIIDWRKYKRDVELTSVVNPISEVETDFEYGTKLFIKNLREPWNDSQIKRVFRYVSELLQPDFLSQISKKLNISKKKGSCSFDVKFFQKNGDLTIPIANLEKMVFDHALGTIEGKIVNGNSKCRVKSKRFAINDSFEVGKFSSLNNIHFKVYYFIYSFDWYKGYIPKMEYNRIYDLGQDNGGVKLYRNGFRVLPYGEKGNDWINIEKKTARTKDNAYVPFGNSNFFGFVEIIDEHGEIFEETSSREGVLENSSFTLLTDFVLKAMRFGSQRINSARLAEKKKKKSTNNSGKTPKEKLEGLKGDNSEKDKIIDEVLATLDEAEMLRVLAGVGLTIAEFTHEIRQFIPAFNGSINYLLTQDLSKKVNSSLINLQENFNRFRTYTSFIDNTITQNVHREKQALDIRKVVNSFFEIIKFDTDKINIQINVKFYEYDLITTPMHPSEWNSILYNLYTNSKKAIKRAKGKAGKILIIAGKEDDKIYLEFLDNGDGIPKKNEGRIFDAFFTTSMPTSSSASKSESISGTGLGLKIVKDIIEAYDGGDVYLTKPEPKYSTCFRIEVSGATEEQLKQYGY